MDKPKADKHVLMVLLDDACTKVFKDLAYIDYLGYSVSSKELGIRLKLKCFGQKHTMVIPHRSLPTVPIQSYNSMTADEKLLTTVRHAFHLFVEDQIRHWFSAVHNEADRKTLAERLQYIYH